MQPQAPENYLLVEIDRRYHDEVTTEGGLKFFQDTTFRPEWHVTVTGRVVSLPRKITQGSVLQENYDVLRPARTPLLRALGVGDEIAFSYQVLFDVVQSDDRDEVFAEETSANPFLTVWKNKMGLRLAVEYRARDGRFNVAAFDAESRVYDRRKGLSELEKDSWLGKFKFTASTEVKYRNLVLIEGKEYWRVDLSYVIGVRKAEGFTLLAPGLVLLKAKGKTEAPAERRIILLNPVAESDHQDRAEVLALGADLVGAHPLSLKVGDRAVYDKRYMEQYTLWGEDYYLIKKSRVLGVENK